MKKNMLLGLLFYGMLTSSFANGLGSLSGPVFNQSERVRDLVHSSITQIERAYARRSVVLNGVGEQPLSAGTAGQLFPNFGFAPRNTWLHWAITTFDADRSQICTNIVTNNVREWRGVVRGYQENGLQPALENCGGPASFSIPLQYPHITWGARLLDRRDYPVSTLTPNYPVLSGFAQGQTTSPAVTITTGPYQPSAPYVVTVHNPLIVVATTPAVLYKETGITSATLRAGFSVEHNCASLLGGESCQVSITYMGTAPLSSLVTALRLEFSTGEFALISVRGKTLLN
jgi:hypothetical protein